MKKLPTFSNKFQTALITLAGILMRAGAEMPADIRHWIKAKKKDPVFNRDKFEMELIKRVGAIQKAQIGKILEALGDPPKLDNIGQATWDEIGVELTQAILPVLQEVYLEQAKILMDKTTVGVDWALVNRGAVNWARGYTFDLVKGINATSLDSLRSAVGNYYERALTIGELENLIEPAFGKVRAEMIAVTEVTRASAQGEQAIFDELTGQGVDMIQTWETNDDELVCEICGPLDGQPRGEGWDEPPPAHVNCLPGNTMVLPIGGVSAGSKRQYQGDIIVIQALEHTLPVTPNHPILTREGWIAAGDLVKGDEILCYGWGDNPIFTDSDEQHRISAIQDIFSTIGLKDFRVPVSPPDFHGDGANSKIAIIRANGKINHGRISNFQEHAPDCPLVVRDIIPVVPFEGFSTSNFDIPTMLDTTYGVMGGLDLAEALLRSHPTPFDRLGLGLIPGGNVSLQQSQSYSIPIDMESLGDAVLALAGKVTLDKVIQVNRHNFCGHVYNLQTDSGLYVAAGIITHNCRCWINSEFL